MMTTSEVPPVEGLIVKTAEGKLGMVTRVSEYSFTVQVFQEGQVWVPKAPKIEPKDPHRP